MIDVCQDPGLPDVGRPPDEARVAVALEVISCEDALALNGKLYYDHYMHACKFLLLPVCQHPERHSTVKKTKGCTPIPSSHASRPSFDTRKAMIIDMLVEAPQSHRDAKKYMSALPRHVFLPCIFQGADSGRLSLRYHGILLVKCLWWKIIKSR